MGWTELPYNQDEIVADIIATAKNIKKKFKYFVVLKQTFVLAGYAGTGKTTLLKTAVCEILKLEPEESCAFVTPTGKAATVLIRSGIRATTLHKLIYQSIIEETEVEVNGRKITVEKLSFKRRKILTHKQKFWQVIRAIIEKI